MKNILLLVNLFLLTFSCIAQAPNMLNYQGIARDRLGVVIQGQTINLRLSILSGSASGSTVYQETRKVLTNTYGLINVRIGDPVGILSQSGTIAGINWGESPSSPNAAKYLKVEMDPSGGNGPFVLLGSTQLVSVPFALGAYPIGNAGGDLNGSTFPNPQIFFPLKKTFNFPATELINMTNSATTGTLGAISGTSASSEGNATAISGTLSSTSTGALSAAIKGTNNATGINGVGVFGKQNGSGYGVYGITPNGIGVYGVTIGLGSFGVKGESISGFGVYGISNSSNSGWFQNTNVSNASPTTRITTNGIGVALNSVNNGSGGSGLFQVINPENKSAVLTAQTDGKGRIGFLQNTNDSNDSNALEVQTNGLGKVGVLENTNATNKNNVLDARTSGTGRVGYFQNTNASNATNAFEVQTNGLGNVGFLQNSNPLNTRNVVEARTNGIGRVSYLQNTNATNSANALEVQTNGLGKVGVLQNTNAVNPSNVLDAKTNGTGRVGYLQNTNTANSANALEVQTNGLGKVGVFENTNVANLSNVLDAKTNGTGRVGYLQNTNTANSANALEVQTNGLGKVGVLENTNVANPGNVLDAKTNGTGRVGYLQNTNTSNSANALEVQTNGLGKVGVFENTNVANPSNVLDAKTSGIGRIGYLLNTNSSNAANGLEVQTNGLGNVGFLQNTNTLNTGNTLMALSNGTGRVGYFQNTNTSNSSNALEVQTNGIGNVGVLQNTNSLNTGNTLIALTNGIGRVGYFQNTNPTNHASAIEIQTNGLGNVSVFQNSNALNTGNVMNALTNGMGSLGFLRNTNATNTSDIFDVHSNGLGNVGVFHNTNAVNTKNALNIYTNGTGYAAFIQSINANPRGLRVDGSVLFNGPQTINGTIHINDGTESTSTTIGALTVNGGVGIGKRLNVGGVTSIYDATESTDKTTGALVVNGGVGIGKNLNIEGASYLKGNTFIGDGTPTGGILSVNSNAPYIAYFNNVSDGNGIAISLGNSLPNSNNNFISFTNSSRNIIGRIEGQTIPELMGSTGFNNDLSAFTSELALKAASAIADLIGIDDPDQSLITTLVDAVLVTFKYNAELNELINHIGVSYESGNGDYAEWLKKEHYNEKFSFGDVVAVNGGVISKNTKIADHYLVISMAPIVLGNMPPKGQEINYEKVAFMGQVPVKVKGIVNIGDYIIPSGNNDGIAIAVVKTKMSLLQYKKVIGVAWSGSHSQADYSLINVAIGITTNSLVDKIEEQENEITLLKVGLNNITTYLAEKDPSFKIPNLGGTKMVVDNDKAIEKKKEFPKVDMNNYNLEHFKSVLLQNPSTVAKVLSSIKKELEKRNINIDKFPKVKQLLTDQNYFINSLGKDASYFRQ